MCNSANLEHKSLCYIPACGKMLFVVISHYPEQKEVARVACIVKQTNKKSGVVYVYRQESYWSPEKKQPRSHRVLLGRLDPTTGEIVPTGKSGPRKASADPGSVVPKSGKDEVSDLKKSLAQSTERVQQLEREVADLKLRNKQMANLIGRIRGTLEGAKTTVSRTIQRCIEDCSV